MWVLTLFVIIGIFYVVPNARSFKDNDNMSYYDRIFKITLQYLNEFYVDSEKIDLKKLYYGAIQGMYRATGDNYTNLLEPKVLSGLLESIKGEFEGIGAYVGMRSERVVIISPIDGTPAYRAGLKPGDVIMKINKKDTEGMKLEEAVSLLRGPSNTKVKVEVYRKGLPKLLKITIQRQKIEIPSVKSTYLRKYKTGYLKITNFAEHTLEESKKALRDFNRKGMKKLIIDLRYNPGGALDSVVAVADLFLKEGLIVYTVGKKSMDTRKYFSDNNVLVDEKVPIAILVNKGSASASEILAGAMKDRKRAVIIGEQTFGKGSVQNVFKVPDKNKTLGLKITIAKYYTPGGYVISKKGITPDKKVKMPKMKTEEEFYSMRLLEEKHVQKFVNKYNKKITNSNYRKFKKMLIKKGIRIRDIFIKKMIREEQNYLNGPKIIDLDYDSQMKKAIEILKAK